MSAVAGEREWQVGVAGSVHWAQVGICSRDHACFAIVVLTIDLVAGVGAAMLFHA